MTGALRSFLLGGAAAFVASALTSGSALAQANVCASGTASTTICFNGGGSSLAGPDYTTAFGIYEGGVSGFVLNYGQSSSGTGTTAFIQQKECNNYAAEGSSGPGTGGCPQQAVDFAASDAFLSSANYLALANSAQFGITGTTPTSGQAIIQLPMFATPVTIAYNIPGFNTSNSVVNFNDQDLLYIFSGTVTNFNDSRLSQNATANPLPNQPITVVYRSDGSGTSFLFTTHLAAVTPTTPLASPCGKPSVQGQFGGADFAQGGAYPFSNSGYPTSNPTVIPNVAQTGTTNFSYIFTGTPLTGGGFSNPGCGLPSNFVGASGSGGVQAVIAGSTTVTATVGAIGYLSPDYTQIAPTNAGASNGVAGANNVPYVAEVNGVQPTSGATAIALSGLVSPTTAAQLANPENFAPLTAIPTATGAYPIVGYTYWFLGQCYSSAAKNTDIKNFLIAWYTTSAYSSLATASGFYPLSGSGGLGKQIVNYILKNTTLAGGGTANVDIGDSTVCASVPTANLLP